MQLLGQRAQQDLQNKWGDGSGSFGDKSTSFSSEPVSVTLRDLLQKLKEIPKVEKNKKDVDTISLLWPFETLYSCVLTRPVEQFNKRLNKCNLT